MNIVRTLITILAGASIAFAVEIGRAAEVGPGVSDKEIKIGNTMPYSGPASAYGIIGKTESAYFNMLNEQGGINGRRLTSSAAMMVTAHRRPLSKYVNSSNKTTYFCCSARSERQLTPPSTST